MYGDVIRNAISKIADILNRNKTPQIKINAKGTRVLPTILKNDNEETRVENKIEPKQLPKI